MVACAGGETLAGAVDIVRAARIVEDTRHGHHRLHGDADAVVGHAAYGGFLDVGDGVEAILDALEVDVGGCAVGAVEIPFAKETAHLAHGDEVERVGGAGVDADVESGAGAHTVVGIGHRHRHGNVGGEQQRQQASDYAFL